MAHGLIWAADINPKPKSWAFRLSSKTKLLDVFWYYYPLYRLRPRYQKWSLPTIFQLCAYLVGGGAVSNFPPISLIIIKPPWVD